MKTEKVTVHNREGYLIQTVEHVMDGHGATCECHEDRPVAWIVSGMQLCEESFNHPTVRCRNCSYRQAGKYVDTDGLVTCPKCGLNDYIEDRY